MIVMPAPSTQSRRHLDGCDSEIAHQARAAPKQACINREGRKSNGAFPASISYCRGQSEMTDGRWRLSLFADLGARRRMVSQSRFRSSTGRRIANHALVTPHPSTSEPASRTRELRWFAEEVLPHGAQLKAYLRNAYPSVRDVDDFVQESYLRIWKAKAGRPIQSAKAFLFQIARHLALDFVRRERSCPIDHVSDLPALSVIDGRLGVVESVSRNEKIRLLADAIDNLPGRCREIFILRRLKCIPQKDVAARLGLSERTVEVQVLRGLKRCEGYLHERGVRGLFSDECS